MTLAAIAYHRRWHDTLLDPAFDGPDALQVMADHFFADPSPLDALSERYPIVVHDVGCSVVGAGPSPERVARLIEVVRRARARAFTDHLAMTRSPAGIELGHLFPPLPTEGVAAQVISRVRWLQDALGVPVALENVSAPFRLVGAFSEAELFHRVVDATGCGVLLDVTNVALDARNDGVDPLPALCALPLSAVRWVHLAGGRVDGDWWVDSHSAPVDPATLALFAGLRSELRLDGWIVEWDSHLPPVEGMVAEARRARAAWEGT
ncbi:MAG: DUF692 family multinuclear iron-containing protein [Myxococcota bacterium]